MESLTFAPSSNELATPHHTQTKDIMKTIKAHFADGNSLITSINGTDEQIRAYYVGKFFNLGDGYGNDYMSQCLSIEFLLD